MHNNNNIRRGQVLAGMLLICGIACGCLFKKTAAGNTLHNRVYFYNMAGSGVDGVNGLQGTSPSADMLIIESDGHFGLIDSGHRYDSAICDRDGTEYQVPNIDANGKEAFLSSQINGKNGRDAAAFCHEKLDIDHFDFIIATHSHSDHIGGMPYFAEYSYIKDGKKQYLVDEQTVYFYKEYHHISETEDDFIAAPDKTISESWHNQAFFYNALEAMRSRNAVTADVSGGIFTDEGTNLAASSDFYRMLHAMENTCLTDVRYDTGTEETPFDDTISFTFGSMKINLYNLYSVSDARSENANSIAAVITVGNKTILTAGDLDSEYGIEQQLSKIIYNNHGTVNIMKANHHGYNGSDTKEALDTLRPEFLVVTRGEIRRNQPKDGGMPVYYCLKAKPITKTVYEVGLTDLGIMAEIRGDVISFYNIRESEGNVFFDSNSSSCINAFDFEDGWYYWAEEIRTPDARGYYYYIKNNVLWKGWLKEGDKTYYLSPDEKTGFPEGAMVFGKQIIDGKEYSFDPSGCLIESS